MHTILTNKMQSSVKYYSEPERAEFKTDNYERIVTINSIQKFNKAHYEAVLKARAARKSAEIK